MTFIFDTGSSWTWLPNADCPDDECAKDHYFYKKSDTYRDSGKVETVKYGVGSIEGRVVTDHIALSATGEFQAQDVNFLSVYHAVDLASLESDGLLGLSPRTQKYGQSGAELHLLVSELRKDGAINSAVFAMYLADRNSESKI